MIRNIPAWLLAAGLAVGCADPAMEQKVNDLTAKVETLQKEVETLKASPGGKPAPKPVDEAKEKAAGEKFDAVRAAIKDLNFDAARSGIAEIQKDFPDTRVAKATKKTEAEIAVVGKDAPNLEVEKWYTKSTDFSKGKATLVVFWEVWCPHCREEVPRLQETWTKYQGKGLNMVALTKLTRSSTEEKVNDFIKENNLTYPMGKEKGSGISEAFGVQGIPAAALVRDNKVIWRGHPAQLTDETLDKAINGSS